MDDENHSGGFYVTQEVFDKFNLVDSYGWETIEEYGFDGEELDELKKDGYSHRISFMHFAQVVDNNTGEWVSSLNVETPWGVPYEEEFVANEYNFPVELFSMSEEDGVNHVGFCDGWIMKYTVCLYETLNHPPTQQEEFDSYWEATLKFQEYKVEGVGDVEIVDEEMETILYHDS